MNSKLTTAISNLTFQQIKPVRSNFGSDRDFEKALQNYYDTIGKAKDKVFIYNNNNINLKELDFSNSGFKATDQANNGTRYSANYNNNNNNGKNSNNNSGRRNVEELVVEISDEKLMQSWNQSKIEKNNEFIQRFITYTERANVQATNISLRYVDSEDPGRLQPVLTNYQRAVGHLEEVANLELGPNSSYKQQQVVRDADYQLQIMKEWGDRDPTAAGIMRSLKPTQFRQYHSRVYQLLKSGFPLSLYGLADFIFNSSRTYAHASLTSWGCSVVFFCKIMRREVDDAERAYWKAAMKGYVRAVPEGVAKVKGAITGPLMEEMMEWGQKKNNKNEDNIPIHYRNALWLQHAGGFRTGELQLILPSCITWSEKYGCHKIVIPKQKDPHAPSRTQIEMEVHYTDPKRNELIRQMLQFHQGGPDSPLDQRLW